jgi:hypothetical protein
MSSMQSSAAQESFVMRQHRFGSRARRAGRLAPTLLALLAVPVFGARADEKPVEEEEIPAIEELMQGALLPKPEGEDELVRLFQQVERDLERITDALAAAGAGDASLEEVEESGIDALLRATSVTSAEVVRGIERILEIAEERSSQSQCSTGQQGQSSSGQSPLDQERDTGPQEREEVPEGPRDEPGGEEQGEQQPDPQREGDQDNPPDGRNREAQPDGRVGGQAVGRREDTERWGNLPERVRETLRVHSSEELPVQYRDWIDAYYRRLNQKR